MYHFFFFEVRVFFCFCSIPWHSPAFLSSHSQIHTLVVVGLFSRKIVNLFHFQTCYHHYAAHYNITIATVIFFFVNHNFPSNLHFMLFFSSTPWGLSAAMQTTSQFSFPSASSVARSSLPAPQGLAATYPQMCQVIFLPNTSY